MPSLKDSRGILLYFGVYKIVCSCGTPYIGETGWSFITRIKEHSVDMRHERISKSALAEHASSTKLHVCLENTQILFEEDNFFKHKLEEAIEINNHSSNLNRDEGWSLSHTCQPLLSNLFSCPHLQPRCLSPFPTSLFSVICSLSFLALSSPSCRLVRVSLLPIFC